MSICVHLWLKVSRRYGQSEVFYTNPGSKVSILQNKHGKTETQPNQEPKGREGGRQSRQPRCARRSRAPAKVAPMFRPVDWLTLAITFGVIWIVYLLTLAPEQTLEDSGELCTGAFYAGIPHPPGYPFWSVYAWFWTAILPFGNVAWRVEVGESFAAAMGCGLLALMVSRGSSMLIEGIEAIKDVPRQWENAICSVSGFVAGTLLGLDVFMWSESVVINRISLFGVPWLIAVLACLMRWMYAPQQRRYLYLAMFLYGLCATIHQTLLLSAMGMEVAIALASPRLGRDLFVGNSVIFLGGLMLMGTVPALQNMSAIEKNLFYIVGIGSLAAAGWLAIGTKGVFSEFWTTLIFMGLAWVAGVCVYFYEAVSGMTDPPMQWGYPRTVEGFFHALSRGQYDTTHGTNIFSDPSRFVFQLGYIVQGLSESFSWVYFFIGLLPFAFLLTMHKRERSWIIGLTSIYFCLSVLLVILLDVSPDRSSTDLNKVFFTASHGLFAMMIGYGLTLMAAYTATHYQKVRGGVSSWARWRSCWRSIVSRRRRAPFTAAGGGGQSRGIAALYRAGLCQGSIWPARVRQPDSAGVPRGLVRRLPGLSPARSGADHAVPVSRHALVVGPLALVQERAAQPLVRLLVRPRHVHPAVHRPQDGQIELRQRASGRAVEEPGQRRAGVSGNGPAVPIVVSVDVSGNAHVPTDRILSVVRTKVGQPLDERLVREIAEHLRPGLLGPGPPLIRQRPDGNTITYGVVEIRSS